MLARPLARLLLAARPAAPRVHAAVTVLASPGRDVPIPRLAARASLCPSRPHLCASLPAPRQQASLGSAPYPTPFGLRCLRVVAAASMSAASSGAPPAATVKLYVVTSLYHYDDYKRATSSCKVLDCSPCEVSGDPPPPFLPPPSPLPLSLSRRLSTSRPPFFFLPPSSPAPEG